MNKKPFITVFTPNYNNEKFIAETIESIINQSYSNFEYIIIDDGSTDKSWEIIQHYKNLDNRIKAYRNKKNIGIVKTRNKGFKYSSNKSKYFAIIDSDDIAMKNRLEIQVDFLEKNPEYGLVGSNILIINEKSEVIGYRKYPIEDQDIRKVITRYDPFAQPSIMLRKTVIDKIGNYDERWQVSQDYDYFLRVGRFWKLKNLEIPLTKYRLSSNQVKRKKIKEILKNTYKIQNKAIIEYGYQDNIINKFLRIFLRLIYFFFPSKIIYKLIFYLQYQKIIKNSNISFRK